MLDYRNDLCCTKLRERATRSGAGHLGYRLTRTMTSKRKERRSAHAGSSTTTSASELESSVARRITRLTAALGDPFGEDPRLAPTMMALDDADRARSHSRRRPLKDEFLSRVD